MDGPVAVQKGLGFSLHAWGTMQVLPPQHAAQEGKRERGMRRGRGRWRQGQLEEGRGGRT